MHEALLANSVILAVTVAWVVLVAILVMIWEIPMILAYAIINTLEAITYAAAAAWLMPDPLAYIMMAIGGFYAWGAYRDWRDWRKGRKPRLRKGLQRIVVTITGRLAVVNR